MEGRPEGKRRLGPSYEDDFADPRTGRRFHMEWMVTANRRTFRPPFDVYETDQHIVIMAEIAGMREEDFAISVDGQVLHISGTREDSAGKLSYQRMEINYGEFRLDIRLPSAVDRAKIEATYDRGFLSICVPRQAPQRKVPITAAEEPE